MIATHKFLQKCKQSENIREQAYPRISAIILGDIHSMEFEFHTIFLFGDLGAILKRFLSLF